MLTRTIVSFILLCFTATGLAGGESMRSDPRVASALKVVELWLEAKLAYEDIPGISAGIVYDQKLIWSQGFGYADIEKRKPALPTTIYSICSISKLFTSIAVMQLRDAGKLHLDDPVQGHLSWFQIKDAYPEAPPVTLRGILTHSSGLPREADFPYWTGPEYRFPTREQIMKRLAGQEKLYPAFTYFQYSNLGLALAGEVVSATSGSPYAEYVQGHILDPLGLKNTTPEIPAHKRGGQLATGYSRKMRDGSRKEINWYQVQGMAPAAGFASTVEDLARFASWQLRLLEKGGTEVLAANTLKEMQRVHWLDSNWQTTRGLGFSISRRDDQTFVGHGGSCPGYKTNLSMLNKDKIAVIVMSNGHDVNVSGLGNEIFSVVAPEIEKAQKGPGEAKILEMDIEKFIGRYDRPLGGETHVLILDGELVTISFPTDSPKNSLTRLKRITENTFKRIRSDGELAEPIFFEIGLDGEVTRMIRNSNYSVRVR